jgi:hypothetical protein
MARENSLNICFYTVWAQIGHSSENDDRLLYRAKPVCRPHVIRSPEQPAAVVNDDGYDRRYYQ